MELKLKPAERSALRAQAHALDPVVMIGGDGLTPAVLKEIDANLKAHELIKVRVLGDDRDQRAAYFDRICGTLDAAPVQHIGKLLVVWRPRPAEPEPARTPAAPRKTAAGSKTTAARKMPAGRKAPAGRRTAVTAKTPPARKATRRTDGAPREVLVVKPSRTGRRPPTRKVVTVLGNERVTAGGIIKRAKPRQKSVKKRVAD